MTYAAQVRSVSKSVTSQHIEDDFYDISSLRIICKYFVGSIVTVKTTDEIIEGVLHTISHNKICITIVTISKINSPDIITETAANKIINLSDVLFISTKGCPEKQEVTVKGKYFQIDKHRDSKDCKKPTQKSPVKLTNGKTSSAKPSTIGKTATEKPLEQSPTPPAIVDDSKGTETAPINADKPEGASEPKKTFSFNPNAPEFKPRANIVFSDNVNGHILFSPLAQHQQQQQQFPPVFPPNSAPAIFVPNIFFYAPTNQQFDLSPNSAETNSDSSTVSQAKSIAIDEQFVRKSMSEIHIGSTALPFQQIVPIFPPALPIFVPNHSFKFNALPFGGGGAAAAVAAAANANAAAGAPVEIATGKCGDDAQSVESEEVDDNELSNPSNWPPLPNPGNQFPNLLDNNQK